MQVVDGLLLSFLADVLRDTDLKAEFLANPDAVTERYGLDANQVCALFSVDPGVIAAVVQKEAADSVSRVISVNYPVPVAEIDTVDPEAIDADTAVKLTITGKGLMSSANIVLSNEVAQTEFSFTGSAASGPFEKRVVEVDVELPKGVYRLALTNCATATELVADDPIVVT